MEPCSVLADSGNNSGENVLQNGDPTAKICLKLIEIKELVQKYHYVLVGSALV